MKTRLLLILLGVVGVLANFIAIPWLLLSVIFAPNGTRAWKIIVAYDCLANVATGGNEGETITMRSYKASLNGNLYGCWLCKLLDKLQPNHCENSVKGK